MVFDRIGTARFPLYGKELSLDVASREEERFDSTLKQGSSLLEDEVERLVAEGRKELTGDIAFRLHDTWGFPVDITTEIAAEAGLTVDRAEFDRLMTEQRDRARAARDAHRCQAADTLTGKSSSDARHAERDDPFRALERELAQPWHELRLGIQVDASFSCRHQQRCFGRVT